MEAIDLFFWTKFVEVKNSASLLTLSMLHTLTAGRAMTAMTLTKNHNHNYAKLCAAARAKYTRKKILSKYESHFRNMKVTFKKPLYSR